MAAAAPPPPALVAGLSRALRVAPLSDPGSPSTGGGSARSSRGSQLPPAPPPQQPPPQVLLPLLQLPLTPEQPPAHYVPVGNMPALPGYGTPMQIPPGYAYVPAQSGLPQMPVRASPLLRSLKCFCLLWSFGAMPAQWIIDRGHPHISWCSSWPCGSLIVHCLRMQGMAVYGGGHFVPIGAMGRMAGMAMPPQTQYSYMATGPQPEQALEGTPLQMSPLAVPRPTHMLHQAHLTMYPDYHTAAGSFHSPQV